VIRRVRRPLLVAGAGLVALGAGLVWLASGVAPPPIPAFEVVRSVHRPSDARLLDRHGDLLHELRIDPKVRRLDWIPLSEISPALVAAVLASEDRRFHRHGGVDPLALAAAAIQGIRSGGARGASTISMQLAPLLHPDIARRGGPRTLLAKWRQMRAAWALEARWSKVQILEAYLNRVTFRGELQGVAAASRVLFGKAPHGLSDAEAAVLAASIRAPNAAPERLARRALALDHRRDIPGRTVEISTTVARLGETSPGGGPRTALAPHLARRVWAREPGLPAQVIRTTLDGRLQRIAIESLRRHLLASREGRVQDGSVLVADNTNGHVLAYVGSSGDLSGSPHVDGIQARRQAGSTLKPFLYGLALERRLLTPASLLADTPLEVAQAEGLYRPKNYDGRFRGLLTSRTALAGSVNIPAVRTLSLVGVEPFAGQLQRLGFEGLREFGEFYGPSLALGSADVSLWELVGAYRSLAGGGLWSPLRLRPDDDGTARRRVYSEQAAFLVSSILSDRESRSVTFGLENPLATPFWSAVKTGTSKDMRDNWCVGYSQRYTVGVWVGNFSGAPMQDVSGVTGAAPIWLEILTWLHRTEPSRAPSPPPGVVARTVRFPDDIEPARTEWFLAGTEPEAILHAPVAASARIVAPTAGTLVAVDPDIPPSRQRILFEAEGAVASIRWMLNGEDLGPATQPLMWQPVPGRHTLSLAEESRSHDSVTFIVRGSLARSPDPSRAKPQASHRTVER
jgi:penicillin-binding protein 1C